MATASRPKRGSRGYSPRVRAKSQVPKFSSWPECQDGPRLQCFAGYKAGMTHAFMMDFRPSSTTAGQEVQVPVTVLETPPMKVVAVRYYGREHYGMRCLGEVWAKKLDKDLARRKPLPKEKRGAEVTDPDIEEVRVLMHTMPKMVTGSSEEHTSELQLRHAISYAVF